MIKMIKTIFYSQYLGYRSVMAENHLAISDSGGRSHSGLYSCVLDVGVD